MKTIGENGESIGEVGEPMPHALLMGSDLRLTEAEGAIYDGMMKEPTAQMRAAWRRMDEERRELLQKHERESITVRDTFALAQLRALAVAKGLMP